MFERFLRSDDAKQQEADEIIDLVKNTAPIGELRRQREAEVLATRRSAVAEIEAAISEKTEKLPVAAQVVTDAQARVDRAEAELKAANLALMHAGMERLGISGEFDIRISQARATLRKTVPAELIEFNSWLLAEFESTRHELHVAQGVVIGTPPKKLVKSNASSIRNRIETIQKALACAEQLIFEAVDDISGEIAAIKESIPPAAYPIETSKGRSPGSRTHRWTATASGKTKKNPSR